MQMVVSNASEILLRSFRPNHCTRSRTNFAALPCRAELSPLQAGQRLAAVRAAEILQQEPRFLDPFAATLAEQSPTGSAADAATDAAATAYLDEQLLRAVDIVNMNLRQEYRQVVLLGCGLDTRPFRLPWPPGIVLFLLAPAEVHAAAQAVLKPAGAVVPRGCLMRRVPIDLQGDVEDFGVALEAAGYRGDRLSVWGLQGLAYLGLEPQQMNSLLAHAANMAALQSLFVGQLPPAPANQAADWLAQAGLLGTLLPPDANAAALPGSEQLPADASRPGADSSVDAASATSSDNAPVPRLFSAQQQRLSLPQMRVYNAHSLAAEEVGEDFEGHFS